ncbi:hypothetical protein MTO98_26040 [Mucilaginibacter sp. SMC90]|uniref:hypothetical protein n=1 Tax=Mucilaginibacter sp. SMC90 TaxID=2929803 RepID=UPI001FB52377|nr:hypothetical protein [Mucilaginibacter sp. SMC90]UOE47875.1 hypothetical protein MTO98_26040 [Mucilaginibacter sp. SMC90]
MGKQHDTFPGEAPEMPLPKQTPEINQPSDPNERDVPQEDPQVIPDDLPPEVQTPGTPVEPEIK